MADGSLRSISVIFQAFTDKFEKKVDEAGKKVEGFGKKVLKGAATFLAAKVTVDQLADGIERLNQVGNVAEQLQVSPEFIRGVELAANKTGESFEKAQDTIKEFNIRMGEAALGTGPAVEALQMLGFTIEDFKNSTPEEAFLRVGEALASLEDPQLQIFAAGEIFGGAGEDMLKSFGEVRESMEKMKDIYGPVKDEDIEAAQSLKESMSELGKRWDAVIEKIGAELAPVLEIMIDALAEVLSWVQKIFEAWDMVQGAVERAITAMFYGGEGANIKLGGESEPRRIQAINRLATGQKKEEAKQQKFNLKSFADAAAFQSEKAFNILNPNREGSIEKQQLSELKGIKDGIMKMSDKDFVALVKKDISGK